MFTIQCYKENDSPHAKVRYMGRLSILEHSDCLHSEFFQVWCKLSVFCHVDPKELTGILKSTHDSCCVVTVQAFVSNLG